MKRFSHPTIANYKRVLAVIRTTSGLWERVDKRVVGVYTRDGRRFDFPHDVFAVTEELHKQGINLRTVAVSAIRNEAFRIILNETPPEPSRWKPGSCVISFRIPKESANALDDMMKARHIVGIGSRHQFVRRVALDFAAQRLLYANSHAPKAEWYTRKTKAADAVCEQITQKTDDVMAQALTDYQKREMTSQQIADKHGVCTATLTVWAKKAGLPLRGRGRRAQTEPTPRQREIITLAKNYYQHQVGAMFGMHKQSIHRIVKRWRKWDSRCQTG